MGKLTKVYNTKLEEKYLNTNKECKIVSTKVNKPKSFYIFLDNQAAIQRIGTITLEPGLWVVMNIAEITNELKIMGIELCVYWIPGYTRIPGN